MNELSFEDAITRIEVIIKQISDGNISLRDSLDYYKEAVELIEFCCKELDTANLIMEEYKLKVPAEGPV